MKNETQTISKEYTVKMVWLFDEIELFHKDDYSACKEHHAAIIKIETFSDLNNEETKYQELEDQKTKMKYNYNYLEGGVYPHRLEGFKIETKGYKNENVDKVTIKFLCNLPEKLDIEHIETKLDNCYYQVDNEKFYHLENAINYARHESVRSKVITRNMQDCYIHTQE